MTVYAACRTKRKRATKAEMQERLDAIAEIVDEIRPCSVRQVFYQATVREVIKKSERGYEKVQRALLDLRASGRIPFNWITDNTRYRVKPDTFNSPADALKETAMFYRRSLWRDADVYVEFWLEKDALAGVVDDVTIDYDVPLMVARGFSSWSFLYRSAQDIQRIGKPTFIYHLGDYDPSGQDAARHIEEKLREFAPDSEIHFQRLAVTPKQIHEWNLPTRPTKKTDSRAKSFGDESVELDAIPPGTLRRLVSCAIEDHMPPDELERLRAAEESEREWLSAWADKLSA